MYSDYIILYTIFIFIIYVFILYYVHIILHYIHASILADVNLYMNIHSIYTVSMMSL